MINYLRNDLLNVLRNNFLDLSEAEKSILKQFISYLINDINSSHPTSKSQLGQDFFALAA
jgi:hypothetical protein